MRKFTVLLALMIAFGQWGCQFLGTASGTVHSCQATALTPITR